MRKVNENQEGLEMNRRHWLLVYVDLKCTRLSQMKTLQIFYQLI
jgi:hypothetical protein